MHLQIEDRGPTLYIQNPRSPFVTKCIQLKAGAMSKHSLSMPPPMALHQVPPTAMSPPSPSVGPVPWGRATLIGSMMIVGFVVGFVSSSGADLMRTFATAPAAPAVSRPLLAPPRGRRLQRPAAPFGAGRAASAQPPTQAFATALSEGPPGPPPGPLPPTIRTLVTQESLQRGRGALLAQIAALFRRLPLDPIRVGPAVLRDTVVLPRALEERLDFRFSTARGIVVSAEHIPVIARGQCVTGTVEGPYALDIPRARMEFIIAFGNRPPVRARVADFTFSFVAAEAEFRVEGSGAAQATGAAINAVRGQLYDTLITEISAAMARSVAAILNRQLPAAAPSDFAIPNSHLAVQYAFASAPAVVREGALQVDLWARVVSRAQPHGPEPGPWPDMSRSRPLWASDRRAKVAVSPYFLRSAMTALYDSGALSVTLSAADVPDVPWGPEVYLSVRRPPTIAVHEGRVECELRGFLDVKAEVWGRAVELSTVESTVSATAAVAVQNNVLWLSLLSARITDLRLRRTAAAPVAFRTPKAAEEALNVVLGLNLRALEGLLPTRVPLPMLAPLRLRDGAVSVVGGQLIIDVADLDPGPT